MEFKGTKGDWKFNEKETSKGIRCISHSPNIDLWSIGSTIQETRANAKLIAAAPELLKALIELKIMAEGNNQYAFELAEEAINKALK